MNAEVTMGTLSSSLEDYLETVYQLVKEHKFARVRDIAKARNVKAGSVSPALKRLAELFSDGEIDYRRLERPTVIRNQAVEPPVHAMDADSDYLDIPAFLRRQAD